MDDMNEIEKLRRSIASKSAPKHSKVLQYLSYLMVIFSLALGFLIYAKKDYNSTFINNLFDTDFSFQSMNAEISKTLDNIFNFNLFDDDSETKPVAGSVQYISLGNNLYQTEDQEIPLLNDGTIIYAKKQDQDQKYDIMVNYTNGAVAIYFDLDDCLVTNYDILSRGDIIAHYQTSFKVLFYRNDALISYEEALS